MIRINKLIVQVKKALKFRDEYCEHDRKNCGFYDKTLKCCVLFDQDLEDFICTSGKEPSRSIPIRCEECLNLFGKDDNSILLDLIHEI
jgi:hypothetical protein